MQSKDLTGHEPYPHQTVTYESLAKLRYPLPQGERARVRGEFHYLRALTGSEKSEVVFVLFIDFKGKSHPKRMIYSLPMVTSEKPKSMIKSVSYL
ncbi:MAG: hypothetical protein QMC83_05580 [Thermodesulfovibrionales bacterium]|nr:hypothetical protein [Thermodesulfovibrionales bacterium]